MGRKPIAFSNLVKSNIPAEFIACKREHGNPFCSYPDWAKSPSGNRLAGYLPADSLYSSHDLIGIEDLNLRGNHLLLSLDMSDRLATDCDGEPLVRICNFELLRRVGG